MIWCSCSKVSKKEIEKLSKEKGISFNEALLILGAKHCKVCVEDKSLDNKIAEIKKLVEGIRYNLSDEKQTQEQIANILQELGAEREYRLDNHNIVDFFMDGLAIEIKIKGQATKILRQCEKYCEFEDVRSLLLITAKSMGFPDTLKEKPAYYIGLSKGML